MSDHQDSLKSESDEHSRVRDAPALVAKARNRWYVPDPNKAGDLEKLREESLLKEFREYKETKKKLKIFREARGNIGSEPMASSALGHTLCFVSIPVQCGELRCGYPDDRVSALRDAGSCRNTGYVTEQPGILSIPTSGRNRRFCFPTQQPHRCTQVCG